MGTTRIGRGLAAWTAMAIFCSAGFEAQAGVVDKLKKGAKKAGKALKDAGKKIKEVGTTAVNAARTFVDPTGYVQACLKKGGRTPKAKRITGPCNGGAAFCGKRYDEVVQAMTHNGMAALKYGWAPGFANHCNKISAQLGDGVRGLMLDSHVMNGKTYVCHGSCKAGKIGLADVLKEIGGWLVDNPQQVVTINWENGVSAKQMKTAVKAAGLEDMLYVHGNRSDPWPTFQKMIRDGKRLVFFTSSNSDKSWGFHDVSDFTWENGYAAKTTGDFACKKRYGNGPVFTLNHFLTDPLGAPHLAKKANKKSNIIAHAKKCQDEVKLKPTFIAVDWYELGDIFDAVRELNAQ
jgi:hypothetical protein